MPFGLSWTEVVIFVVFFGGGIVAFAALVAFFLSRFLRSSGRGGPRPDVLQ